MTYLSVCSGIEAATVAWHPLGFTPVAFSEVEPFPCAVLTHHYPGVPNWGDMTRFKDWPDAAVDTLVGGTPCQSFSVAGLRAGLDDPRGSLLLTFLAIAGRYRPRWLVWENVPGVLSSDKGRAFGSLLGGLAQLGYGFAHRLLDAQYFGLAQRRQRVFVVGHLGDWRRAAAVLVERESLSGHPAPGREAREGITCTPAGIAGSCSRKWSKGTGGPAGDEHYNLIVPPLDASYARLQGTSGQDPGVASSAMIRRLTPRECERLQGFPDDYTLVPYRFGKLVKDGPRYKALGNSMAVPVMRWIGARMQQVDGL